MARHSVMHNTIKESKSDIDLKTEYDVRGKPEINN